MKDNSLEDKLSKCYSQMGICNDENILLGKCDIEKQIPFLTLLNLFIKNVHLSSDQSSKNDKEVTNIFTKIETENISPNINVTVRDLDFNKSIPNITVKFDESSKLSKLIERCNLDESCANVKESMKKLNEQSTDTYDSILQKFNLSFDKVTSMQSQTMHSNIFCESYNNFSNDIQNIQETFCIVNKTLTNEDKIKNRHRPENVVKTMYPLTQAVKNNVVLVEQACNVFREN